MLVVPFFHIHPEADHHHGDASHVHGGTVHTVFSPDLSASTQRPSTIRPVLKQRISTYKLVFIRVMRPLILR